MALFDKKTWQDRLAEFPGRVNLRAVEHEDDTYDMQRADGTADTEGDTFSASTMNGLEERIETAFLDAEDDLEAFKARRDNPHEVTAEQTGTYTAEEIRDLLSESGGGGDCGGNCYSRQETELLLAGKANYGTPQVFELELADGFQNSGNASRYWRDGFGVVHVEIAIDKTTGNFVHKDTLAYLPEGYRRDFFGYVGVGYMHGSGGRAPCLIVTGEDGAIDIYNFVDNLVTTRNMVYCNFSFVTQLDGGSTAPGTGGSLADYYTKEEVEALLQGKANRGVGELHPLEYASGMADAQKTEGSYYYLGEDGRVYVHLAVQGDISHSARIATIPEEYWPKDYGHLGFGYATLNSTRRVCSIVWGNSNEFRPLGAMQENLKDFTQLYADFSYLPAKPIEFTGGTGGGGLANYYTKEETDALLLTKANKNPVEVSSPTYAPGFGGVVSVFKTAESIVHIVGEFTAETAFARGVIFATIPFVPANQTQQIVYDSAYNGAVLRVADQGQLYFSNISSSSSKHFFVNLAFVASE